MRRNLFVHVCHVFIFEIKITSITFPRFGGHAYIYAQIAYKDIA